MIKLSSIRNNFFHFVRKLEKDKVSSFYPDHFMASIEVESLFTNIPLNEVIDICIDDLPSDTNTIHNLDRNDIRELLTLAAYESFFIFNHVMYRQFLQIHFLCHCEK